MIDISQIFLTGLVNYGTPMFVLALLLGGIGFPLPVSLLVVAAGAFSRQGYLDPVMAASMGLVGVVIGDSISYAVGRFARQRVLERLGGTHLWQRASQRFEKRGGLAVFLTRFLITSIAFPTNLVAGSSGYSFRRYIFFDLAGELFWIGLYGGLGYLFGSQWEVVSDFLTNFGGFVFGMLLFGIGGYLLSHYRVQVSHKVRGLTAAFAK